MLKKISLQKRLSVSIVAVLAICLLSMTYYSYQKSSALIKEEAYGRANELGKRYALQIEQKIDSAFWVIRSIGATSSSLKRANSLSRDGVLELLKDNLLMNDLFFGIGLYYDINGFDGNDEKFKTNVHFGNVGRMAPWVHLDKIKKTVIEPSDSAEMDTPGKGDWYLVPKKNLKESIIEPYVYSLSDGSSVTITSPSYPIVIDGKFAALAAIDIKTDTIQKLVSEIQPYEEGFASLISSEGKFIYNRDKKLIDQSLDAKDPVSEKILKAINTGSHLENDLDKYYQILTPIKIGETGKYWGIVINIPKSKVLAGTIQLAKVQLTLSLISMLVVTIMIIILSMGITKPLTLQNEQVELVGQNLTTYSNDLLKISKSLADSSIAQSNSLIETSSAMDEINSMVSRNNDAAKKSKEASDRSKLIAIEGKNSSDMMVNSMNEIEQSNNLISKQTEKGNKDIHEIINIFNNITEKTKVINDIVFQTKLLSFNASVEAARAGENGKGFAVVAEEVGKLAEMSGSSAKEISDILSESSGKVNQIISQNKVAIESLIQDSTSKVSSGIKIMEDFRHKLDQITTSSESVSALVNDIVEASAQQTLGVAEVSKAINHLDTEAKQNSILATDASASAEKVKDNSDDLKVISIELNKLINGDKSS